jgi:predicted transposase/invertase (TIGR01784 family)
MNFQFPDNADPIDIRLDHVFKAVFTKGTPESQGALSHLLSAIIGRTLSVTAIEANEPPVFDLRERQIRFDINCKADTGEYVNIEMSLNPNASEPLRLEYYSGKLFASQSIKGAGKKYANLKESYQIAILAKRRFFDDNEFYHSFEYYDPQRRVSLGGRTRIITLELSKVEQAVEKPASDMTVREQWAIFFEYLTNKEKRSKINEILGREEGIAMAGEALMTITKDEIEWEHQMSRLKYELDLQNDMTEAREEGERKGRLERDYEIARNLKKRGAPISQIAEDTGLSINDIAEL